MSSGEEDPPPANCEKCPAKKVGKHWLEYAIFVAAFGAAVFTARQAYLGNKQLRVARDVLDVTRDQEHRQLRAYVGIKDKEDITIFPNQPPKATYTVKNLLSPATNATVGGRVIMLPYPLKQHLRAVSNQNFYRSNVTIFPTDDVDLPVTGDVLSQDQLNNISIGTDVRLYIIAHIDYDDIWGKPHHTHFCLMSEPGTAPQKPHRCDQYNDAD